MSIAVSMRGITQKFGEFTALDAINLEVKSGELHAIVGENGAGKTTLMNILYGALHPTGGSIEVNGSAKKYRSSREAIADGIGMVSQHYAIIPELTCLQNLILGAEPNWMLNRAAIKFRAQELADKMGFSFDWDAKAESLGPAGAQKLEILKLLWRNARIMILDEPTAMLSPRDADALFESLKSLAAEGATVILVTHRLPEVTEFCQNVTVLRGGKLITAKPVESVTHAELAELIVGKSLTEFPDRDLLESRVLLNIQGLVVRSDRGHEAVKSASFQLHEGELVGLAGVDGNGQRELFQALLGVRPTAEGTTSLNGDDLRHLSTRARLRAGLRIIPEDRHHEAVIEDWSLEENAMLGYQRFEGYSSGGGLNAEFAANRSQTFADRFKTKYFSLKQPIGSLSGGNQQRFVTARALAENPRCILAFQPTRGLDIEATRAVYAGIREACAECATALVVSFDLDELLEFCDRVLVINGGVVSEPTSKDRSEIGLLMVGGS